MDSWQTYFSKQFSNLFSRVGKIRSYKVAAEFFENLAPVQQKGRRVPISLQEKVDAEIDKLLKQGHIEKLSECSDKYFVSPIVITVKKDGSVKLALESRELNKQVHKNKYQMPNIEELMDTVGQTISEKKTGRRIFHNNGFNIRLWPIATKCGDERPVQFFANWRSFDGYIPVQNRILWPHYNARGIPTRNGLYTRRIPASARVYR